MSKLTFDDLLKLKEANRGNLVVREGGHRVRIDVHLGDCGVKAGAREIMGALMREINERGIQDIILTGSGCAGLCPREPMMEVEIAGEKPVRYGNLTPEKIREIFYAHILEGRPVGKYTLTEEAKA
jgi:NADP-reducing hydrogenase subunit HndB